MGFSFFTRGSFKRTESWLLHLMNLDFRTVLERSGEKGVAALAAATPRESGLSANSWDYGIEGNANSFTIFWYNTDVESGFKVALMIQLGHGTGTGGYIQGRDYINPAMRPVFEEIEADIRKAVTSIR